MVCEFFHCPETCLKVPHMMMSEEIPSIKCYKPQLKTVTSSPETESEC